MRTSETIGALAEALAKAQASFPDIDRNREVEVTSRRTGGKYTFRYATLDNIVSKIKQPLSDQGLAFIQALTQDDKGIVLETRLMHASGEWLSSTLPIKTEDQGWQALGSAITYAKRYAITAMLGIAADEDDDANASEGNAIADRGKAAAKPKTDTPFDEQSRSDARAEAYVEGCLSIIRVESDAEALKRWWNEQASDRRKHQLVQAEVDRLKDAVMVRFDELTTPQKEAAQ